MQSPPPFRLICTMVQRDMRSTGPHELRIVLLFQEISL